MSRPTKEYNPDFDDPDHVHDLYDDPSSEVEDPIGGDEGITYEDAVEIDPIEGD